MKVLACISSMILSAALPASAATTTVAATATILEPSVVPTIAAMPDELRVEDPRYRQVNAARRDLVVRDVARNWPVVIEFE